MIVGRLYREFFCPEGTVSRDGKGLRSYAER